MYICNLKLDYIYNIEFIFIKKLYFSDDTSIKNFTKISNLYYIRKTTKFSFILLKSFII